MMPTAVPLSNDELNDMVIRHGLDSSTLVSASVVVQKLGRSAWRTALHEDIPFYPACMIKVPLGMALRALVQSGDLSATAMVDIPERCITETAIPSPFSSMSQAAVCDLDYCALTYSDNIAYNVLLDYVGRERGTQVLHDLGLTRTALRRVLSGSVLLHDPYATGRNAHPPVDAAFAFQLIAERRTPGADDLALALRRTNPYYRATFGIIDGEDVLHKDGYTQSVYHNAFAITPDKGDTYVIAVYSGASNTAEYQKCVAAFVTNLAERVWR